MKQLTLVEKVKTELRVSSFSLASELGIEHPSLIKVIKQYKTDFEEFGIIGFEIRKLNRRGRPAKFVYLNEDQSYFALTLSDNTINSVRLKKKLTKEFSAYRKIAKRQASDKWIERRTEAAIEYRVMSSTLQEKRKLEGKATKHFHYANEAKLVNFAMIGEFSGINRKMLSQSELHILTQLEIKNAVMIGAGLDRKTRKATLVDYNGELKVAAIESRLNIGQAPVPTNP